MGRERRMKDTGRERTFVVEILEKEPSTFFFFFFFLINKERSTLNNLIQVLLKPKYMLGNQI